MRAACVTEFLKKTSGSMTVEFIVLVPMLLVALGFAYEFGRAMWAYDVMTRDVRAAVRYLSRTYPYDATSKGYAINVARTGIPVGGTTHFPWGAPWSSCSPCVTVGSETNFSIGNYNENGFVFSVTGAVPLTLYFLGFLEGFGFNTSYTLTVTDRARYIGN